MGNNFSIKIADAAAKEIMSMIERFILDNLLKPNAADLMITDIRYAFKIISSEPHSGDLINNEHIKDNQLRKMFFGNFIIFYQLDAAKQEILVISVQRCDYFNYTIL